MNFIPPPTAALHTLLAAVTICVPMASAAQAAPKGKLTLRVTDKATGQLLAARIHIKNSRGRPVLPRDTLRWKDHFVFDGTVTLELSPGNYTFELEHGPEYRIRTGSFQILPKGDNTDTLELERFVDMRKEGWWSGDLHIHRDPKNIDLLTRAEDLDIAPVITWWNKKNLWTSQTPPRPAIVQLSNGRWVDYLAGEDEREGGALLFLHLDKPLPIATAQRDYPSSVKFLQMAKQFPLAHVDAEKPFWWDLPLWLSTGLVDSIGIANNHMWRDGMLDNEAWGKPRDKHLYPSPLGNAEWTQDIYYRVLDCGLRIPPSAGSASGVLPNPVGYNRVYVHCGDTCTYETWLENLRKGRVVVTNGPMLRPRVNQHLPGEVFQASRGETLELQPTLKLALREKIDYLQYVKNGRVHRSIPLKQIRGSLPKVEFKESGWLIIRAVTKHEKTYRFASSGPFYVEFDGQRRVSRAAAQFFLDWLTERARRLSREPPEQFSETIAVFRQARDYWRGLVESANAE